MNETAASSARRNDRRILLITGAGISAESGIPTFRGQDGYWRNLDPTKLATTDAFLRDPELVWEWYRERRALIRRSRPNAAHESVVQLAQVTPHFLLLTQNVDNLHARAEWHGRRLAPESIVQIHGNIFVTRCLLDHVSRIDSEDSVAVPTCPQCGGLMRPGVVWFDEELDGNEVTRIERFLAAGPCDFVIAVGTTASFDYIVDWAVRARGPTGQLIEVNPDESALSQFATEVIRDKAAVALPLLVERLTRELLIPET